MLEIGDVVLYDYYDKSLKWYYKLYYKIQQWFDRGRAHHSAIYIGDGKILETMTYSGVRIRPYYSDEGQQLILRVLENERPSNDEFELSIDKYYKKHKNKKYSRIDFTKAILYKIFKLKFILENSPIEDICSGLVYEIYKDLGFKKLIVTPNDFSRSKHFYVIKNWKEGDI